MFIGAIMTSKEQPPLPGFLDDVETKPLSPINLIVMKSQLEDPKGQISPLQLILPGFEEVMGMKSPISKEETNHGQEDGEWWSTAIAVDCDAPMPAIAATLDA
jgi:hypothetical protein